MNKNQIKLNMSRNSNRALVASVYINEQEVFGTSKGYQLGCALHAMGVDVLEQAGDGFTLAVDEMGTFLGHEFGQQADERVFFGELLGAVTLAKLTGGKDDPAYYLVRNLLPQRLLTGPVIEAPKCPEESIEYFKKFIYYPFV